MLAHRLRRWTNIKPLHLVEGIVFNVYLEQFRWHDFVYVWYVIMCIVFDVCPGISICNIWFLCIPWIIQLTWFGFVCIIHTGLVHAVDKLAGVI